MFKLTHNHQLRSTIKQISFNHSSLARSAPQCLVLHPVSFPNKGPAIEQYLAEEAIGLVSSLRWEVVRGPFWQSDGGDKKKLDHPRLPPNTVYLQPQHGNQIKDGTYVRTTLGTGMLYKDGIMFDEESTETDGDLHSQWQNKVIRQSLANSSLVKCKKITQKYFFTKGKLERIIAHILKTQPTCLFINSELKPGQIRNLKKLLESQLNNKNPPKGYNYSGDQDQSQTQFESTQEVEQVEVSRRKKQSLKKIQIFDRFSIILQIFAQRTTSKLAKLQIELSYLAYLKTRLVRDGSTYSSNLNIFSGSLLNNSEISLQIISAKQRRAIGTMSGEGQSQLEIERRNIRNQEAKIRREIEVELKLRHHKKQKEKSRNISMPIIALIGYTNVGKSAFLNYVMGKNQVQSKDLLFQTLKTTSRFIELPSGTRAALMDTIGFITDLPVEMIDSFKATLEDIAHADLVIHLRDLSHPQHELQKESVLAILKQLKFSTDFYTDKMIQVWNKIDLVQSTEHSQARSADELRVSCKTGANMGKLLSYIDEKVKKIRGLSKKKVTYGFDKHDRVMDWLRSTANISYNLSYDHNYETSPEYPKGSVTVEVDLDQALYNKLEKYIREISNKQSDKDKSRKGMPPKQGW